MRATIEPTLRDVLDRLDRIDGRLDGVAQRLDVLDQKVDWGFNTLTDMVTNLACYTTRAVCAGTGSDD